MSAGDRGGPGKRWTAGAQSSGLRLDGTPQGLSGSGPPLHGVSGLVAGQRAREIGLDFLLSLAAVLLAELHADARGALALFALAPLRRDPDDASRDGQLLVPPHRVEHVDPS